MRKGDKLYSKALKLASQEEYDYTEVISLLKEAIETYNNSKAAYALATWYLYGKHVRKSYVKAFELLNKSIEWEPNKNAYFNIAVCYEIGKGTKKDEKKAFQSYLLAAFYGDNKSKYEIGRCFYYGIGIEKNEELGLDITNWFSDKSESPV